MSPVGSQVKANKQFRTVYPVNGSEIHARRRLGFWVYTQHLSDLELNYIWKNLEVIPTLPRITPRKLSNPSAKFSEASG